MSRVMKKLNDILTVKLTPYLLCMPVPCPECKHDTMLMMRLNTKHNKRKDELMLCPECARKMFVKVILNSTPDTNK